MTERATLKQVGIVGLGTMGRGIAQVTAQAGYDVRIIDQEQSMAEGALEVISKSLQKMVQKEVLEEGEKEQILSRIHGEKDLGSFSACDLIIEAVFEDFETKKNLLHKLDGICSPETIFATNTSTLSVTKLASGLSRLDRIVGLHFFNPVQRMKLIEVVNTVTASDQVIKTLLGFVESLGKEPVLIRDQAGFLVNFLLTPYLFDAIRALSGGLSTVREIDNAMRYGCGYPMGPLALCDLIGLDILVNGAKSLLEEYHDARYAPPPLLKRLVELGDFGIKSGRGFYDYQDPKNPKPRSFFGPQK